MSPAWSLAMRAVTQKVRRWVAHLVPLALGVALSVKPGFAYRPFDGTDAAVAKEGEMEVELQPAGVLREGTEKKLIAPATRLNYGFAEGWEAVLEGQLETPLPLTGPPTLRASGAFLKGVLHPGSLQDKQGISFATEFGALLPNSREETRFGASMAWIVSQRWDWGAVHLNMATSLTREHNPDLFLGTILEGPSKWKIRPVAEVFYEKEFGEATTLSGLVGLIWQVRDDLSFDVAVRHAVTNHANVDELRAGLTFGFPLRPRGRMKH